MFQLPDLDQPIVYTCQNQIFYIHHCMYSPIHYLPLYHDELFSDRATTISNKTIKTTIWKVKLQKDNTEKMRMEQLLYLG